jgi:hypothetical protein
MPSGVSHKINSNWLIPRSSMPLLTNPRPLKADSNGTANTDTAVGGDLIAKVVSQSSVGVGVKIDLIV